MSKGIGREFMELTQYRYLEPSDQVLKKPQPPLEIEWDRSLPLIELPLPQNITAGDVNVELWLQQAIERRQSVRDYGPEGISLAQLSYLLWSTQGVKKIIGNVAAMRTVPSAGARHALETYLLVNNVADLAPGLYRFLAIEHKLGAVSLAENIAELVTAACLQQKFVKECVATFVWVAVPYRMTWRYGERGYRYLHLDAGHVCQNLYLAAEAIGCGVCAIGAFRDEDLNAVLGLDGEKQFAIYAATVGKLPHK